MKVLIRLLRNLFICQDFKLGARMLIEMIV